jgi:hypothetical protein
MLFRAFVLGFQGMGNHGIALSTTYQSFRRRDKGERKEMEDSQLIKALRNLYTSKDAKPKDITPTDLALVSRLLLQKADEEAVYPGKATLELELNCGEWAITESLRRLESVTVEGELRPWVTVESGARRQIANRYRVLVENLPIEAELKRQPKRIFKKGTERRYAYRFQTLFDRCQHPNGSKWLFVQILNFALSDNRFKAHALAGPHKLPKVWRSLVKAFAVAEQTQKEKAA